MVQIGLFQESVAASLPDRLARSAMTQMAHAVEGLARLPDYSQLVGSNRVGAVPCYPAGRAVEVGARLGSLVPVIVRCRPGTVASRVSETTAAIPGAVARTPGIHARERVRLLRVVAPADRRAETADRVGDGPPGRAGRSRSRTTPAGRLGKAGTERRDSRWLDVELVEAPADLVGLADESCDCWRRSTPRRS